MNARVGEAHAVIVIGAGGHARVLLDALTLMKIPVAGLTDADPSKAGQLIHGVPVLGDDRSLERFPHHSTRLVNGLGSVSAMDARRRTFESMRSRGYRFISVVHPSVVLARDAVLGEGVQLFAGAIIQCGATIGEDSIVNTGAQVDHDCNIGCHVHLAPGATLSGDVHVGQGTHIGTGAVVVQGVRVGSNCLIAAGAVVIDHVPDGTRIAGVPARDMRR